MKAEKIRDLSKKETTEKMKELHKRLIQLNAQSATGTPPENPGEIKRLRRTIARIKTVLKEKGSSQK